QVLVLTRHDQRAARGLEGLPESPAHPVAQQARVQLGRGGPLGRDVARVAQVRVVACPLDAQERRSLARLAHGVGSASIRRSLRAPAYKPQAVLRFVLDRPPWRVKPCTGSSTMGTWRRDTLAISSRSRRSPSEKRRSSRKRSAENTLGVPFTSPARMPKRSRPSRLNNQDPVSRSGA